MSRESSAEAMSERELEELKKDAQRTLDGSIYKEYEEVTVSDRADEHASDIAYRLVEEVRRSHTEAAELKEQHQRLVEDRDYWLTVAKSESKKNDYLAKHKAELQAEAAELRERVGDLADTLDKVSNCAPPDLETGRFYLVPEYLFFEVRAALPQASPQAKLETRSQEEEEEEE